MDNGAAFCETVSELKDSIRTEERQLRRLKEGVLLTQDILRDPSLVSIINPCLLEKIFEASKTKEKSKTTDSIGRHTASRRSLRQLKNLFKKVEGSQQRDTADGSPMSSTDVRLGVYSPFASNYGSLSRSATTSKVVASPKAFGEKTYMNKEDHERERTRWLTKLEEIEARLAESETLNSDMQQIRAELNKKIVELEKNQRPLIDQNRKVSDRNKVLLGEVKKVEQKLCHSQDDYLTLKDAHDRLVKENATLKEKRAYPEKLEELDRYRNQVLEYSKCITALRSAGLEKDRRYDLLVQKFKRLRRCLRRDDDDGKSTVGSDCSTESSINLDTINEDFEESFNKDIETTYQALYRENAELQRALNELKFTPTGLCEETLLRDQLACAHTTIEQQQLIIERDQEMIAQSAQLRALVASQQEKIRELEKKIEDMKQEIAASKDKNELLEFQVLEMEETRSEEQSISLDKKDQSLDTDDYRCEDANVEMTIKLGDFKVEEVSALKKDIAELTKSPNLRLAQRQVVGKTCGYIENLEEKITASTVSEQAKSADYEDKIKLLQAQVEDSYSKQKKKKELQVEVEDLRKKLIEMDGVRNSLNNEMKSLSKELAKMRSELTTKDSALEKEKKLVEGLNNHLQELVHSAQTEQEQKNNKEQELSETKAQLEAAKSTVENLIREKEELLVKHHELTAEYEKFKEEQRPSIRTELERRYEETRYRLNNALEKIQKLEMVLESAKKSEEDSKLSEALQEDLIQLKVYNEQLENQFKAQTDIIDALKERIIKQRTLADFVNKLSDLDDIDEVQTELGHFAQNQDKDTIKFLKNIAHIVTMNRKNHLLSSLTPLEISTAHHKICESTYIYCIRPYNSVDSSGEWMSNSSEGVNSPDRYDSDWNEKDHSRGAHVIGQL